MSKHRYNTELTRRDLVAAGREVFAEVGYAAAATADIAARARLTRGALYHQFGNKQGLFLAVVESLQTEVTAEVDRRATEMGGSPMDRLRAGFQTYLDLALRHDVRQIILLDGPAVLGWDTWSDIDQRGAHRTVASILKVTMDARTQAAADRPAELAKILLGAVAQAALEISRSPDPANARHRYGEVIDLLLTSLRSSLRAPLRSSLRSSP